MGERRYTLSEIDRMREYFTRKFQAGRECWDTREEVLTVEEWVRTTMIGGVDPQDCDWRKIENV